MLLDRTSPLPLYVQLKTILSEEIQSGALKPGDALGVHVVQKVWT